MYLQGGSHGSCIHHLGQDICFDEYNYHDSLQVRLILFTYVSEDASSHAASKRHYSWIAL